MENNKKGILSKIPIISIEHLFKDKTFYDSFKIKLKSSMAHNLAKQLSRVILRINKQCKSTEQNYFTSLSQQKNREDESVITLNDLSTPDMFFKMTEDNLYRHACDLSKQRFLKKKYDIFLFLHKNKKIWMEKNFDSLIRLLKESSYKFPEKKDILNEIFSLLVHFANNPDIASQRCLNFSLLGFPGSGKTSLAYMIQKALLYSGIVILDSKNVTIPLSKVTQKILEQNIYGTLIIEDSPDVSELYSKRDNKKEEILSFLQKHKGEIVLIVTGDPVHMSKQFFAANSDLSKCFPFLFVLRDFSQANVISVVKNELKKNHINVHPSVYEYLHLFMKSENIYANQSKVNVKFFLFPNAMKDIKKLSAYVVNFFISHSREKKIVFTPKDLEKIIYLYMAMSHNKKILHSSLPSYEQLLVSSSPQNVKEKKRYMIYFES